MNYDVFSCMELNTENVNKAFNDVWEWMCDINMSAEADELIDYLAEALKQNNPFNLSVHRTFDIDPTNKIIRIIYELAENTIKEKYPDAEITWSVNGYNSKFAIDDATYQKGWEEYQKEDDDYEEITAEKPNSVS